MKYIMGIILSALCLFILFINTMYSQNAFEVVVFNVAVYEGKTLVPAANIDVITQIYDTSYYSFALRTQENGITQNAVVGGGSSVEVFVQSGCHREPYYFVLPLSLPKESVLTLRAHIRHCTIYGPLLYR